MNPPEQLRASLVDPREVMAIMPMSLAQKLGVMCTLLLTTTDGYDILAMSFAAPSVTVEWGLTRQALGFLMAMNLIGMGLGSVLIAPLADRFGRRNMVLVALIAIAASMFFSAAASTPVQLGFLRLITGLCIGGMVGPTLSLATEYANLRNRALTASIMSVGLPIGGMLGAMVSAALLLHYDWRLIFIVGGATTSLVVLVSYFLLPEAVDFLILRPGVKSRTTLNAILRRYGRDEVSAAFVPQTPLAVKRSYAGLFTPEMRWTAAAMILINFAMMTTIWVFPNLRRLPSASIKISAAF
jgi:MFS family permease